MAAAALEQPEVPLEDQLVPQDANRHANSLSARASVIMSGREPTIAKIGQRMRRLGLTDKGRGLRETMLPTKGLGASTAPHDMHCGRRLLAVTAPASNWNVVNHMT